MHNLYPVNSIQYYRASHNNLLIAYIYHGWHIYYGILGIVLIELSFDS